MHTLHLCALGSPTMAVRPQSSLSNVSFGSSNQVPGARPASSMSISRMSWASGDEYYVTEDLASSKRFAVPCLFGPPDQEIPPLYGCNKDGKPLSAFEPYFTGERPWPLHRAVLAQGRCTVVAGVEDRESTGRESTPPLKLWRRVQTLARCAAEVWPRGRRSEHKG